MFQQMTEIALRGLAYLIGRPRGEVVQSRQIGDQLGISGTYVAKAFQPLARSGWLRSVKGRSGGWVLEAEPERLTIQDAIDALEPENQWQRCPVGHRICDTNGDPNPDCPFHDTWERTVVEFGRTMRATSLARLPDFLPPCYEPPLRADFPGMRVGPSHKGLSGLRDCGGPAMGLGSPLDIQQV